MARLLIVVDYQNDFVTGPLGYEGAELLEEPIYEVVREAEDHGDDIIFTRNVHEADYLQTEEGKNLPVPHCIAGSGGEDIFGKVKRLASRHVIFDKPSFGSNRLGTYLISHEYDVIDLCGMDLSNCVLANAIIAKTACPNAHIRILKRICGCRIPERVEHAAKAAVGMHIEIVE